MERPPTREEAILAAASRALEHAKEEAADAERRKNADPETLKRVEEAKKNRVRRKDLLG
ncbi:MAG: hypothetical protein U5R31_04775 [Acidimicrobiia bacterium]|nr:hypothetical protein [Acidimicrobiia bacterium]